MKKLEVSDWPKRRRNTLKVRIDFYTKKWLEEEYPSIENPEKLRRIRERLIKSESLVEKLLKVKKKI